MYEPWGVALAEAMGSGLPTIATQACGAAVDLIRPFWNGRLVATGSAAELAEAMIWFHNRTQMLPEMSKNAVAAASGFTSASWAERVLAILERGVARRAA